MIIIIIIKNGPRCGRRERPTSAAPMGRSPVNTATSFAKRIDRLGRRFVSKYIKSRIKLPQLCPVLNGKARSSTKLLAILS